VGALVQEMGSFVEHIALVLPCAAFGGLAAWCGAGEPLADGFAAVAVTLLALAAAAWYALAERMWHTWDNLSIRPLFAPTQPGERNEQRLVACAVVLIGLVPLGVAAAMATGAGVQDVRVFMWNAVWIAPMLPMAVALLLAPLVLLGYGGWALIVGYRKLRGR
jgi:hypothetical protein